MALVRVVVTPGGVGTAEDAARAPTMGSGPAAAAENTQASAIGDRGTPAIAGSGPGPVTRSAAVDLLEWRAGADSGADLRGPGRVGPVSVHAEMTAREADSAVGPRGGHERAKADSGPAAVTPNEGVWAVDPSAEPGRARPGFARANARSELHLVGGHPGAPAQVRADSGRVLVTPGEVDSEVGPREAPRRARVVSGRVDVTPNAAASVVDPRGMPGRARADSGPVRVTPSAADSEPGPRGVPGRASPDFARASARSEGDPALGHRGAPGQVRADSGLGRLARSAVDSEVGPREEPPRARAVSGRADVTRGAVDSEVAPREESGRARVVRVDVTPAVDPRGRPARARAASARQARGPHGEARSAVGRVASEHCPAVAVHEDPAPAHGVEVEVGGAAVGAEPAPASPG